MGAFPKVSISQEMIDQALKIESEIKVFRTKTSHVDTVGGALGEFAFAAWFTGDWRLNEVGKNAGAADFNGVVEVKTSIFPFSPDRLNLLVREDYASKRKPPIYVQVFLDVASTGAKKIAAGTQAVIAGFAYSAEVESAPKKDFGSKFGGSGGYLCRYIPVQKLHPMAEFRAAYKHVCQ